MTTTAADAATVRAALAAFATRDLDRLLEYLTDDIAWRTPGQSLLAGDFHGKAAVRAYLERALALSTGTIRVEPVDVLLGREHVAVVVELHGERGERTLDERSIQLFQMRDGRIAMRRVYPADQAAFDAFWA